MHAAYKLLAVLIIKL